jgi:hypothetical protein
MTVISSRGRLRFISRAKNSPAGPAPTIAMRTF